MAGAENISSLGSVARVIGPADEHLIRSAADFADYDLIRKAPEFSAARPTWTLRRATATAIIIAAAVGLSPAWGGDIAALTLAMPFACIVLLRLTALVHIVRSWTEVANVEPVIHDQDLPSYSVVIPVYDETAVAPALVDAMRSLNYPVDRLQILFVTEEHDEPTRAALFAAALTKNMRVLTVPKGELRTKPRALNFALKFATGEFLTVFDAEDVPEPDQLRRAVAQFAASGDDLVCLQARLNIYNPGAGFFTRQFMLEYSALFDAILPSLARLGMALPLGGSSNHFRRAGLIEVGAWDPYNVTEDADLGFRLARLGKRVEIIQSTTWEEAPAEFKDWLGQRARWLKGWMQTYNVHMRDPARLWRELGAWRFIGFQITLGGPILSALVHPWIYVYAIYQLVFGDIFDIDPAGAQSTSITGVVCVGVLATGYLTGIALVAVSVWSQGGKLLLSSACWLPVYWLFISLAAYRALADYFTKPWHWQKTPHSARPAPLPNAT